MTTVTPENLSALLELQQRDTRMTALAEALQGLQSEPELVTALKRRQAAVAKAKELDTRRTELVAAQATAEQKLTDVLDRLEKDRARRDAGGSVKEVSALQRQIESLTTQVEKARAARVAAATELESFMQQRAVLMPKLQAADAEAKRLVAATKDRGASMQTEHQELAAGRDARVAAVGNTALVTRYERIRTGGHIIRTAATERTGPVCGSCGSTMSPAEVVDVEADATQISTCPSCGAIFVN
ncbi:zinc ribbon domain-containing protein [Kocuria sp.]|uniref:zinc ribbon domain-containing protein n=1 Tax=Kocuria sp. TaxID=1871328 RepID=UPI0026E0876D|nr:hypothetical protein [Kocuria sp.]MDO5618262.1 hypothetical protein [Kocuria sp.]